MLKIKKYFQKNSLILILSSILLSFVLLSFTLKNDKSDTKTETKYYLNKTIKLDFEEATAKVTKELKKEGFGIATSFDVNKVFKEKLDIEFRKYRILGACNPTYALRAINAEDKIGTVIPCNVMLQEVDGGTEIAIINPISMVSAIDDKEMKIIADEIYIKLKRVIESL